MKIITLKGKSKSGKTTAITNIFNKLKEKCEAVQFFERTGADNKDFTALITYKNKKIAFCSIGDIADKGYSPIKYIMIGINFAYERNADIFINAISEDPDSINIQEISMSVKKSENDYKTQMNEITEKILNEIN